MPFPALRPIFASKTSSDDIEIGAISSFKNSFIKGPSRSSALTSKTSEIEIKVVKNLAKFAGVSVDNVFP